LANITIPEAFKELFQPKRYKVFYGGRGGAKSHAYARALLVKGMEKPLRIVCAREIQKAIKTSVHALLADLVRTHDLTSFYQVQEAQIRGINGTEFLFIGLRHNTTGMKSLEGCDIFWIEEAENVSNNSYEIAIPTIRKENSEIWISFNTKNVTDPTYKRFVSKQDPDILCRKVSWRDNPFFPDILNKERLKLMSDDYEAYLHVWEGEPDVRHSGAVHAKKLAQAREQGRITTVPYDANFQVFTAWDLGFGDATSIWWLQFVGRELRWIDFYENNGELLDHYAKIIKEKPYNYYTKGHFLPFDGAAGNIRGEAVPDQLKKMGVHTTTLPKATDLRAERDLLNNTISFSVFDEKNCADGLLSLESFHFEWDEERGRFGAKPVHDWASNASDAARYAAIAASKIKGGLLNDSTPTTIVNKSTGLQTVLRFKGNTSKRLRARR